MCNIYQQSSTHLYLERLVWKRCKNHFKGNFSVLPSFLVCADLMTCVHMHILEGTLVTDFADILILMFQRSTKFFAARLNGWLVWGSEPRCCEKPSGNTAGVYLLKTTDTTEYSDIIILVREFSCCILIIIISFAAVVWLQTNIHAGTCNQSQQLEWHASHRQTPVIQSGDCQEVQALISF